MSSKGKVYWPFNQNIWSTLSYFSFPPFLSFSSYSLSQPSIFLFYSVSFHCLYLSTIYFPVLSCFISLSLSLNHLFSCSILFPFTVHISQPSVFLFYPVSFHCLYLSTSYFPVLSCFIPLSLSLNHLFSFSILFYYTVSISQPSIFLFYPVSFHCPYLSSVCFPFLSCFFPLSLFLNHLFSFLSCFIPLSLSLNRLFSFSILFHSTFAYLISLLSTFHTTFFFRPNLLPFLLSYWPILSLSSTYHDHLSLRPYLSTRPV